MRKFYFILFFLQVVSGYSQHLSRIDFEQIKNAIADENGEFYYPQLIGRLIDQANVSLKSLTDESATLIHEATRTVELVNSPLESFARITKNVEDVTTKVADATTDFIDKSGPAVKVAGALISAAGMSKSRGKKKKKSE